MASYCSATLKQLLKWLFLQHILPMSTFLKEVGFLWNYLESPRTFTLWVRWGRAFEYNVVCMCGMCPDFIWCRYTKNTSPLPRQPVDIYAHLWGLCLFCRLTTDFFLPKEAGMKIACSVTKKEWKFGCMTLWSWNTTTHILKQSIMWHDISPSAT